MFDHEITNKYWEIVNQNNLRDVLVPIAADDGRLRRVTRWLLADDGYPDASEERDYAHIVELIKSDYGLSQDQVEPVMGLCEDNVYRELKS